MPLGFILASGAAVNKINTFNDCKGMGKSNMLIIGNFLILFPILIYHFFIF